MVHKMILISPLIFYSTLLNASARYPSANHPEASDVIRCESGDIYCEESAAYGTCYCGDSVSINIDREVDPSNLPSDEQIYEFCLDDLTYVATLCTNASECYRSAECPEDKVCIDKQCQASGTPLEICPGNGGCAGNDVVCDDGFCKSDLIRCESDGRYCEESTAYGTCYCGDGVDIQIDREVDPLNLPSDEQIYEFCLNDLTSLCAKNPDGEEDDTQPDGQELDDTADNVNCSFNAAEQQQSQALLVFVRFVLDF